MKTEEKLERLKALFQAAKDAGLCFTQRDFAAMVGTSEQTISSAMNRSERFLTERLLFTIERALREKGIVLQNVSNSGNMLVGENNFFTQDEPAPAPAVDSEESSKREKAKKEDHVDRALDMLQTELDRKNTLVDRLVTLLEKKG